MATDTLPRGTKPLAAAPLILYLTFDGLLEPLGQSQIVSYLTRLASRGFRYAVISLERQEDLADTARVSALQQRLTAAGVEWTFYPYQAGGAANAVRNSRTMLRAAMDTVQRRNVRLLHARAHVPGVIACMVRLRTGTPYLFDMRGYWVDECAADGRWFTNPLAYKIGKWVERRVLKDAAAVTTLTRLLADELRAGILRGSTKHLSVIPTCADYDLFRRDIPGSGALPGDLRRRLQASLVVGWVGAINASYQVEESLRLFRRLLDRRKDAHLLALTRQCAEMSTLMERHNIPTSAYTLTTVDHSQMAEWLACMDWALLLLASGRSKIGSVPTKLAEFLASGVRVVQHGCNPEVSGYVADAGGGLVLPGLDEAELERAANVLATEPRDPAVLLRAREQTRPRLGLEAATDSYAEVLTALLEETRA